MVSLQFPSSGSPFEENWAHFVLTDNMQNLRFRLNGLWALMCWHWPVAPVTEEGFPSVVPLMACTEIWYSVPGNRPAGRHSFKSLIYFCYTIIPRFFSFWHFFLCKKYCWILSSCRALSNILSEKEIQFLVNLIISCVHTVAIIYSPFHKACSRRKCGAVILPRRSVSKGTNTEWEDRVLAVKLAAEVITEPNRRLCKSDTKAQHKQTHTLNANVCVLYVASLLLL